MRTIAALTYLLLGCAFAFAFSDQKRGRATWTWATSQPQASVWRVQPSEPQPTSKGSDDALAEVNEYRAKRGLPPFVRDPQLTEAALKAAKQRASRGIHGHLPESDFTCLPAGASADAAGCGALEDSWGWGTCCMDDHYTHAGAAWVRGADGLRYMHLFVRNAQTAQKTEPVVVEPLHRSFETIQPQRIFRSRRGGG